MCINLMMSLDHLFFYCRFLAPTPAVGRCAGGPCACSTILQTYFKACLPFISVEPSWISAKWFRLRLFLERVHCQEEEGKEESQPGSPRKWGPFVLCPQCRRVWNHNAKCGPHAHQMHLTVICGICLNCEHKQMTKRMTKRASECQNILK